MNKEPLIKEEIYGFTFEKKTYIKSLKSTMWTFWHRYSGATVCWYENDNDNLGFSIAYKTPQLDETDINHILEHTIIASSKKYPSKDIFFDMDSKSFFTELNAYTATNYTAFPIMSLSSGQLLKMMDVYLSCLTDSSVIEEENFFKREGIRYSLNSVEDAITLEGIVYTEDLGYLTDIKGQVYERFVKEMYPGQIIANASGKAHINYKDISYDRLLQVYKELYHFSNSLILLYGKLDIYEYLNFLNREYLSKYENTEVNLEKYSTNISNPKDNYTKIRLDCYAYEGAKTKDAAVIYYGVDVSDKISLSDKIALDLLGDVFTDINGIIKQKLDAADIIGDIQIFSVNEMFGKYSFGIEMTDCNEDDSDKVKQIIDEGFREIYEKGIAEEIYIPYIKNMKLNLKLLDEDRSYFFNEAISDIYGLWSSDGIISYYSVMDETLEELYKKEQNTVKRIAKYFIDAKRQVMITGTPKPAMAEEFLEDTKKYLDNYKAKLTKLQLMKLVEQTKEFEIWNTEEKSNNAFMISAEKLPDISLEAKHNTRVYKDICYITEDVGYEDISYQAIRINISDIEYKDIDYLALYTLLVGSISTKRHNMEQVLNLLSEYADDLEINPLYIDGKKYNNPYIEISYSCLREDVRAGFEYIHEILTETDFTQYEDVIYVLKSSVQDYDMSQKEQEYVAAEKLFMARGIANCFEERYNGQEFYYFLKELINTIKQDKNAYRELVKKLEEISNSIKLRNDMIVLFAADKAKGEENITDFEEVFKDFKIRDIKRKEYNIPKLNEKRAYITDDSTVCNYEFIKLPKNIATKYLVFLEAMHNRYIIPKLRFSGNAYSTACHSSISGRYITLESINDTEIVSSYKVFENIAEELKNIEITEEELQGYIIKKYGSMLYKKGAISQFRSNVYYDLNGIDLKKLEEELKQLKNVTVADKYEAAEFFKSLFASKVYKVSVGNEAIIRAAEGYFDEIEDYRIKG